MTTAAPASPPPALLAGLLRAEAYPHPVTEPIRVTETHISWVLLTGDYAYKIKKPLRLSFLDYSTLERRRTLCEEEVRLNRRHAPGLYLGVSTVRGTTAAPRMDGAGEALEYAVRMHQFDAGDELTALLAANAASETDLARLGASIARFHAAAVAAAADGPYGRPDRVHQVTTDNFAELGRLPESAAWRDALGSLESRLAGVHAGLRTLMLARCAEGWVRECHGDLHCGNVVRWQDQLVPFDGIEFDPALRFIDVTNDVAFLGMDLAERGYPALRRAALQAWLEGLGDWAGLPLLPYYETYRALVRAKVAALRALQEPEGSAERDRCVTDCQRYLAWAARRLRPARPALVITCGLSGAGKTWLAAQLAPRLGALHVRSDVERKRLAGLATDADSRSPPDAGIYTPEFTHRTYDRLQACAGAALVAGESIIVDAAFLRRDERLRFAELAARHSSPVVLVHCHAPGHVLRDRVAARQAARRDASEAGLEVLARQPAWWEPLDTRECGRALEVDTSQPDDVARAFERIATLVRG